MRTRFRLFIHFLAVLMVMVSSGVITNDAQLVENVYIPSLEEINKKAEYLHPSLQTVNAEIQKSNALNDHADKLDIRGHFLIDKQNTAHTAAYGGLNWKGKLKSKLVDLGEAVVTNSYSGLLKGFINDLIATEGKIDREQAYALACKAVNEHYRPTVHDAKVMGDSMHPIAEILRNRYIAQNTSPTGLFALQPLPSITIPDAVHPRWRCMGNGIGTGLHDSLLTCLETYYTPYEARDDHEICCGGDKDPNPDVAGCGVDYYSCREFYVSFHQVLYCSRHIDWFPPAAFRGTQIGICGEAFRKCPGSLSRSGVHAYQPVVKWSSSGTYWSGYEAVEYTDIGVGTYTETDHSGNTTPPVAESGTPIVHGSNGVGVEAVIPDESSNCDTCIDGSPNCPNVSAHSGEEEADAGGTTPTDSSWVVCDIEGCRDSTPYDPTSSSAGLHAYCNECYQYKCNGVDHSWQTSCSDTTHTNTNGDSCTASGFYECVSHTPVYSAAPAPPPSTVRCPLCPVSYDPTDPDSYTNHLPVTCINCGVGFTGCTNHESACYVDGQLVGWHTTE